LAALESKLPLSLQLFSEESSPDFWRLRSVQSGPQAEE